MTQIIDSCYRHECEFSRTTDIKQHVQKVQGNFARGGNLGRPEEKPDTPFGSRLRSALSEMAGVEKLSDTEIRKQYGHLFEAKTESGIANYFKMPDRYPDVKHLIGIARFVGCSLDWLLNGKPDSQRISPEAFERNPRMFIQRIRRNSRVAFEETVKELVNVGLDARARELALTYKAMSEDELKSVLDAYFANVGQNTNGRRRSG